MLCKYHILNITEVYYNYTDSMCNAFMCNKSKSKTNRKKYMFTILIHALKICFTSWKIVMCIYYLEFNGIFHIFAVIKTSYYRLNDEIFQLKEKWDRQIVDVSRSQVNKDIEVQSLRENEEKLRADINQKKQDIDRLVYSIFFVIFFCLACDKYPERQD